MNKKPITLVYFSPTATTRIVLEEIAKGTGYDMADVCDITLSQAREKISPEIDSSLVVFGVPVYSGRLPSLAADYFKKLSAPDFCAVPVVLYGNREYDDALLELKDICIHCCACIKACPESARIMKEGHFKDIAARLHKTCDKRKAPELFFASR